MVNFLPFFSQWNMGGGYPVALQKKLKIRSSATLMFFGAYVIFGAAAKIQKEIIKCCKFAKFSRGSSLFSPNFAYKYTS